MSEHTNPVEIDDLIVLLLGATPDNAVKGITPLEKMIFVLERETPVGELLTEESEYQPYRFGQKLTTACPHPFSRAEFAHLLIVRGRVRAVKEHVDAPQSE